MQWTRKCPLLFALISVWKLNANLLPGLLPFDQNIMEILAGQTQQNEAGIDYFWPLASDHPLSWPKNSSPST